ncbi:MAG TPA: hypothetical protein VGR87_03945 [Candidatus Limnocylindria bacterium]|jgi:hypothetical protein|nr:hypothetical protein [Candidatus Limnocylindria bacterium]
MSPRKVDFIWKPEWSMRARFSGMAHEAISLLFEADRLLASPKAPPALRVARDRVAKSVIVESEEIRPGLWAEITDDDALHLRIQVDGVAELEEALTSAALLSLSEPAGSAEEPR